MLQNVKFYDNNVATKNSKQSQVLKDIWKFNSHLDVNYSSQSATTINRDRIYFNAKISFGNEFNVPNPVKILDPINNIYAKLNN